MRGEGSSALMPSNIQALCSAVWTVPSAPSQVAAPTRQPSPILKQQAGPSGLCMGPKKDPPLVQEYHLSDSEPEDQTDEPDIF